MMGVQIQRGGGFSLTEVLVSVFVLGLGVIGAAGMQLSSVRTTQQSRFQSNAVQIASEMADKMRANASQMRLPDEQNPFLAVNYEARTDPATDVSTPCYANSCDGTQLASFDIADLQRRVKTMMPRGRVVICRDAAPWDASASQFRWECDPQSGAGSVVIKIGWQDKAPDDSPVKDAGSQTRPGVVLPVLPYVE